jgi:hypothetical protein
MTQISPHEKFTCYLCNKEYGGRQLESDIGSGKFLHLICRKCTRDNYVWDNNPKSNMRKIASRLGLRV